MTTRRTRMNFLLCLNNGGYSASLETGKLYRSVPDAAAHARGYVRIVDESGEDYLYSADRFVGIHLPDKARRALAHAM
jgi:hypothetical protein